MDSAIFAIARELKECLAPICELRDFRVFGSRARTDFAGDSDLDVYIVVITLNGEIKQKIFDACWEIGFAHNLVISPLIVTFAEVTQTALRAAPIIRNINREGVAV